MDFNFTGKVVLVTGASSGIGEFTAILFAKYGAKLALVERDEERLGKVANTCKAEKAVSPLTIVADLSTDAGCEKVANETLKHFGRLDVLINNAGITSRTCIQLTDMATFDEMFNTNVRGVYNLTRLLVPALIESKGNIVNVSSISATVVAVGTLPYSMAKAAVDHFTRLISLELAPKGVRVNAVSPGITVSNIVMRATGLSDQEYQEWLEQLATRIPMGEVCSGDDVARTIVFLASDSSRLVTGNIVPIDGGFRYGNLSNFAADQMK